MEVRLSEINKLNQTSKSSAYIDLLNSILSKNDHSTIPSIHQFIGSIVQDEVGLLVTKTVLSKLIQYLKESNIDSKFKREMIECILNQDEFCNRQSRFEEQVTDLRESLADLLEFEEDWSRAAKVLQGIPLTGTNRIVTDEYRLKIYIRIVRLLLEDDDATSAETYLGRANAYISSTKDEHTILSFELSQARIFDARRKFEEASKKYHKISFTPNLAEEEREQCLSASLICAILASAGPNRTWLLTTLFRDERTLNLSDHKILSKMFLGQIIKPNELIEFEKRLQPHQLARLPTSGLVHQDEDDDEEDDHQTDQDQIMKDGLRRELKRSPETVFDRAVMQHNLLSASKIYHHITLKGLGHLVGLTAGAVELMARTMIQEGRLKASIDQVERMVTFQRERKVDGDVVVSNVAAAGGGKAGGEGADEMLEIVPATIRWDEAIRETSQRVETIYEQVSEILVAKGITPMVA
ncbi:hypothetical protein DFH28DRAFT_1181886 [Melampsora americana]|nr:hypothetical protein DFH28DRAFT_1181886 [Melampsora americana]